MVYEDANGLQALVSHPHSKYPSSRGNSKTANLQMNSKVLGLKGASTQLPK